MADDDNFDYHWFEHLFAWNRLLDDGCYIDYLFMDTETKRLRTYAALLMLADDRWATAEEIEEAADIGDGNMEAVLIGLSRLREVDVEMFDDGELCFQINDYGRSWANMLMLEREYEE